MKRILAFIEETNYIYNSNIDDPFLVMSVTKPLRLASFDKPTPIANLVLSSDPQLWEVPIDIRWTVDMKRLRIVDTTPRRFNSNSTNIDLPEDHSRKVEITIKRVIELLRKYKVVYICNLDSNYKVEYVDRILHWIRRNPNSHDCPTNAVPIGH